MKQPKIVCLGDSLTEGYDIDLSCRWSDLVSKELKIELINSGISGDTTAGMLARFYNMVIVHAPTHVIIMGGTNDLWTYISEEQVISNILAMTRHANHHDIIPIIGIPTPFYHEHLPPDRSMFLHPESIAARLESLQTKLRQYVAEDEQPFIDFSLNMTPDLFLLDGVHPSEEGHAVMAENATAALRGILA
jgi:lysophospholipase L1-like esterase